MNLFYLYESETQTKLLEDCEPSSLGLRGPLGGLEVECLIRTRIL